MSRRAVRLVASRTALVAALCLAVPSFSEPASGEDVPFAPNAPLGHSLVRHYTAEDYGGSNKQVWMAAQDSSGSLYFLETAPQLLRYDGVRWSRFPLPFFAPYLWLDDEKIYIGGRAGIGYVTYENGAPELVSILDRLPEDRRDFVDMLKIVEIERGIVFCTTRYLYLLERDGTFRVLAETDAGSKFENAFTWQGRLYVDTLAEGLLVLEGDALAALANGGAQTEEKVVAILPYDEGDGSALVLSDRRTLLLRRGGMEALAFAAQNFLRRSRPVYAMRARDGRYFVATRLGGTVVLNRRGEVLELFDEARDERLNNTVYHVLEDEQGNFWFSTDYGIVQVPRLPVRLVVDRSQVEGSAHRAYRHRGRLWVGTRTGLYHELHRRREILTLEKVPGIDATWVLMSAGDVLLAGAHQGIFSLHDEGGEVRAELVCPDQTIFLLRSRLFPDRIFAASWDNFHVLRHDGAGWTCDEAIEGIRGLVFHMAEGDNGEMLLQTESELFLLTFPGGLRSGPEIRKYPLPEGYNTLLTIDGRILLSNYRSGVYRYLGLAAADMFPFEPDESFAYLRGADTRGQVLFRYEEEHGRLWLETDGRTEIARRPAAGARFERQHPAAGQIRGWCDVHRDAETGLYWLTSDAGVYLWDPELGRAGPEPRAHVSAVRLRDGAGLADGVRTPAAPSVLPYADNALRFEFSAPIFDQVGDNEYQYKLEGYDDDWSSWTAETAKQYTNLWEKEYRFRLRARDRWHQVSREASFAFEVRPPPYRSGWAYGLYSLALTGVVAVAWRLHQKRLTHVRAINRRLREIDHLRDEFLANTSHELRTPLYGMVGLAESLLDSASGLPDPARASLTTIVQGGRRLGTLIDDILDFSKLRRHRLELVLAPVELHALTDVVLALAAPLAADKDLELVNAVDASLPPARADADRVQQILHNLVGNAVKYTDSGHVEISAHRDGEHLEVSVRDTGIGIAGDQLERIFESFVQADASIRRRAGGTGLGLAVSRQLVEMHGGTLQVESALGKGSVFSFTVPVATGEGVREPSPPTARKTPPVLAAAPEKAAEPKPDAATVLAVDDEPIVRQVLESHLRSAGYRVLAASSGPEALEILGRERVDLVLLDVMMPKMSGYEVCRAVRRDHPVDTLPILFLSAMNRSEDRVAGLAQGANDYLAKPVAKEELLYRVETQLELLEAQRRKDREVVSLRGMLPICARCKKIRDDEGLWNQVEAYVSQRSEAEFSHGICPECVQEMYPELLDDEELESL